jgi:hypothetical protein
MARPKTLDEAVKRRRRKKKTFTEQTGISQGTVSEKISKVSDEHPELSHEAKVGRALGTLRHRKKKRKPLLA